jgi:hypothetical protein
MSGKDHEFLSFINKIKGKGNCHLVLGSLENLMVFESLGKRTGCVRERRITLVHPTYSKLFCCFF